MFLQHHSIEIIQSSKRRQGETLRKHEMIILLFLKNNLILHSPLEEVVSKLQTLFKRRESEEQRF
jgi:hypothetical protein